MFLNDEIIEKLSAVENCRLLRGDMIGEDFCRDELQGGASSAPEAVAEVFSAEAASELLRLCNEYGVPVTVRGAGTGKAGGSVPVRGGVVMSMKGMSKILGYDPESRILRVQPGVLLSEVKAEAERLGMYYPPDPGEQTATIGGNAATNAGGPCALKYGKTRDYIADAQIILADGSIRSLSEGGDFGCIAGSEGTLAVFAELSLKLAEKPGADAILLLPFMEREAALAAAERITGAGFDPAVLEYMDTALVEFSGRVSGNPVFPVELDGEPAAATLMVTIEGADDDEVMSRMEEMAEMAEELECMDILVGDTPSMKMDFWAAHAAFHTAMESAGFSREANIDLPAASVAEMLDYARACGEEKGFAMMSHAHLGSGGVHIYIVSDMPREEAEPRAESFLDAVYSKCAELDGSAAGEYGVGYAKMKYVPEEKRAAFAAVKARLDPRGILNPGKVVAQC